MINLRYHIVSITAVFLALGLGVALGSTFLDRVTVDSLNARIDSAEDRLRVTNSDNAGLRAEVGRLAALQDDFVTEAADRLLVGTLAGIDVLIVAPSGVDPASVDRVASVLATAGAVVQGTMWFTEQATMADPDVAAATAELLELPTRRADIVRGRAVAGLVGFMTRPLEVPAERDATVTDERADPGAAPAPSVAGTGQTETAPEPEEPSVLDGLSEIGVVEWVPADAEPGPGRATVVVVGGPDAVVDDERVVLPFVGALADAGGVVIVSGLSTPEADQAEEADAPTLPGRIRAGEVGDGVATVEPVDTFYGEVALVLLVARSPDGVAGHYGTSPRADRILPEPIPS